MAAAAVVARALRRKQRGSAPRSKTALLQDLEQGLSWLHALNEIFNRYDEKKSGVLGRAELMRLLADLAPASAVAPPTEEEVDFLIEACEEGGSSSSSSINRLKLDKVLMHWNRYLKIRSKVQAALDRFDESDSGRKLERREVKEHLATLNGGVGVCETDVDQVLTMAKVRDDGTCSKPNLIIALANWHERSGREEAACCVIF